MNRVLLAGLAAAAAVTPAVAHISLDVREAPALGYVRLAVRVPHGCEGAATVAIRMAVPEGVTAVKAQPKPGWVLTLTADESAPGGGHDAGAAVREVAWRGGPLPDAFYEEFLIRVRMPDGAGQTVWFAFVQECEGGRVTRWIERPGAGEAIGGLRAPAVPVVLTPRN